MKRNSVLERLSDQLEDVQEGHLETLTLSLRCCESLGGTSTDAECNVGAAFQGILKPVCI